MYLFFFRARNPDIEFDKSRFFEEYISFTLYTIIGIEEKLYKILNFFFSSQLLSNEYLFFWRFFDEIAENIILNKYNT